VSQIGEETSEIVECPNCGQKLRVPSVRRRGTATCKSCYAHFTVDGTIEDDQAEPSPSQHSAPGAQPEKKRDGLGVQLLKFLGATGVVAVIVANVGPSLVGGAIILFLVAPCIGPIIVAAIGAGVLYGLFAIWNWMQE